MGKEEDKACCFEDLGFKDLNGGEYLYRKLNNIDSSFLGMDVSLSTDKHPDNRS